MSHSTITFWASLKSVDPTNNTFTFNLLTLDVENRYKATINKFRKFSLVLYGGTTIVPVLDFSDWKDSWGFLAISCSGYLASCEIHWGTFVEN